MVAKRQVAPDTWMIPDSAAELLRQRNGQCLERLLVLQQAEDPDALIAALYEWLVREARVQAIWLFNSEGRVLACRGDDAACWSAWRLVDGAQDRGTIHVGLSEHGDTAAIPGPLAAAKPLLSRLLAYEGLARWVYRRVDLVFAVSTVTAAIR